MEDRIWLKSKIDRLYIAFGGKGRWIRYADCKIIMYPKSAEARIDPVVCVLDLVPLDEEDRKVESVEIFKATLDFPYTLGFWAATVLVNYF